MTSRRYNNKMKKKIVRIGLLEILRPPCVSRVTDTNCQPNHLAISLFCSVVTRDTYFVRSKLPASHMADNLLSEGKKRKKVIHS